MIKIFKSLAIVAVLVAIASGATYAKFYNVKKVAGADNRAMTYKTASVEIGDVAGFPMLFDNMLPGGDYAKQANIKYDGTTPGDLYFGATLVSGADDLSGVLKVAIKKWDSATESHWITGWMNPADLYTTWIPLDKNVAPGATVYYEIHVLVDENADNAFQGKTAHNGVLIQAVQAGKATEGNPSTTTVPTM